MIEAWVVWIVGSAMFAAGSGIFFWLGLVKGQQQAKEWLDHVLAKQVNANVALDHANTAAAHANVAQDMKDKRTSAYYASRRGQEPTPRQNASARSKAEQAVNGHDEH